MNDYCRKYPRRTQCEPITGGTPASPICEPFSVCLPFGQRLYFDGYCMRLERGAPIPDGEYGVIVVRDGCIVEARPNPAFNYTPDPCSPAAQPCGGNSETIVPAPGVCNLLSVDAAGRLLVQLNVDTGSGISVTGCGTSTDPLVISAEPTEPVRTYIEAKDATAISLTGDGSSAQPYMVGLTPVDLLAGEYGGFTIDQYGRVVNYNTPVNSPITKLVEGPGIKVTDNSGVVTVGLKDDFQASGKYLLGGFRLEIDLSGRITQIEQAIDIANIQFDPYNTFISTNSLGSIVELTPITRVAANTKHTHIQAGGEARTNIELDRQGTLYVRWQGWEPVPNNTVTDNQIGVFVPTASSVISGTVDSDIPLQSVLGRYDRRYKVKPVQSATGDMVYQITGYETGLVEWRGVAASVVTPGLHSVTLSRNESEVTPFTNYSVVDVTLM